MRTAPVGRWIGFALVLAVSGALPSRAQDLPQPPNGEVVHIPLTIRGLFGPQTLTLEGTLFRPDGEGPFPLAVINDGEGRNCGRH